MNSRTHIGDLSFTWDANKIKTSESITGVMSGYGVTAAGTTAGNEDLCFSSSLPPPDSSLLIDIDANGTADVNFQYDALGRRVARTGTGGSVVFVQMDQQTIADYPVGGAATTPTFRYVYASYIDEPVVRKTAGTGETLVYFHRNHQYSVTAVTTSAGAIAERYAYSAYGQPTILDASGVTLPTSNFSIRTSYTGHEWDATLALHHFWARWVSGLTGRFLSRDPITYRGGINLHEYVSSNPLLHVDPYGYLQKPPMPAPSPGVVGGVCRVVTRRVMLPVTVLVLTYKCGTRVAEYTTIPIAVIVTEWVCSDPNPNPGPNPSPDPPSQPAVNPPQPPRDPNARCWCCDLQTYLSDGSPGGTKNCRTERAAECWAGHLIDVPKPDDLFWTKSLEFGIRTVAAQHERVGLKRDCEIQAFQNLFVKCISSPFESIQAAVLTAIAFDFHDCLIGNRLLILSEALSQHPRLSRYWHQARNEVIKRFDVENAAGNDARVHPKNDTTSDNDSPPER